MTADIERLPLPEPGEAMSKWAYHEADMEAYARACVAHATAAKDAEIERLRAANIAYSEQVAKLIGRAGNAEARAERLAEALALLPDEIDMIENNPDEGMLMSCCGREVKSRGIHDLLITHDKGCWYVSMRALRDHDKEGEK